MDKSEIDNLVMKAKAKSKEFEAAKKETTEEVDAGQLDEIRQEEAEKTFADIGVCQEICEAVKKMGYKHPSKIQAESLPYTLEGRDIIGLAETGSGKTAAFAIPVIQKLLDDPQPFFALVMSPTRELCV